MRAILISIKPKYVAQILNGKKTIEIRKTCPEIFKHLKPYEGCSIDVYIYCTKDKKDYLYYDEDFGDYITLPQDCGKFSGKVVAKFTLNRVDEHHVLPTERILPFNWNVEQKLKQLCLTKEEVMAYGKGQDYQAFLWHISNLVIFDKPRELSEFYITHITIDVGKKIRTPLMYPRKLTKAPQSWQFIETEELL